MKWDENEGDTSYYFNPKKVNRWLKNTDICIAEGVWIPIKFHTPISLIVEVPLKCFLFFIFATNLEKSLLKMRKTVENEQFKEIQLPFQIQHRFVAKAQAFLLQRTL